MRHKIASIIALALVATFSLSAAELKVDINNNNRAISEGLDPAYTSWNDVTAWFPSGANSISKTFSGVTVTFTRVTITNPVIMPFIWSTNIGNLPAQFYRIKTGPPLP